MFRYLFLALALLLISIVIYFLFRKKINTNAMLITGIVLIIAMLLFDNYLTTIPVVMYNNLHILGLRIGNIPIEDVSYIVLSAIAIPVIYEIFNDEK